MNRNEEARRAILGSIRQSLTESAPHDVVHATRHPPPTPGDRANALPVLNSSRHAPAPAAEDAQPLPADPLARFQHRLEGVAGKFIHVRGPAQLTAAVEQILRDSAAKRVAVSDSPRATAVAREACERSGATLVEHATAMELFRCDVGISTAQWGIAETGTLMLESEQERHRLVSLIPRVHITLLRADRICDTLGDALHHSRGGAAPGEVPSAAITLITGPSRTSDIELTLAIGVHGPQELYVVVLEPRDAPEARHPTR